MNGETADRRVIVAARLNNLDLHTRVGRRAARQQLVASGTGVAWQDEHGQLDLALPDQTASTTTPKIASVVRASFTVLPPGGSVSSVTTVLFLAGADGTCLVKIAQASPDLTELYDDFNLDRIWPRQVFSELEGRGVDYREETFPSPDECQKAHPGSVSGTLMAMGTRAWWLYAAAFAALLALGAVLLLAVR